MKFNAVNFNITLVNCEEALNAISGMSLFLRRVFVSVSSRVTTLSSIFYLLPKREEKFSFENAEIKR